MVRKGNLAVFEGSSISETMIFWADSIKNWCDACYINAYLNEFFEPIPID